MRLSYSIENLRRLTQTPLIDLRPITILLGRNSAGKSTFLRSLLLFKQSLNSAASAPILWYGDIVDFGDFDAALNRNSPDKSIRFTFNIDNISYDYAPAPAKFNKRKIEEKNIFVQVSVGTKHGKTILNYYEVKMDDGQRSVRFLAGENGTEFEKIEVNGITLDRFGEGVHFILREGQIFAPPFSIKRVQKAGSNQYIYFDIDETIIDIITSELEKFADARLSRSTIRSQAQNILNNPYYTTQTAADKARKESGAVRKLYVGIAVNDRLVSRIDSYCCFLRVWRLLPHIQSELTAYFSSVQNIAPARVQSERYYRKQELQVSDISPNGHNLPIVLASWGEFKVHEFSSWLDKHFGFGIAITDSTGHISIELLDRSSKTNVVDTGYGMSQVLPVLAQAWLMSTQPTGRWTGIARTGTPRTLAVEQPELHLHPHHQAILAEAFCELVVDKQSGANPLHLLIETHSEAIVNKVGELVALGKLDSELVQIVIFGADEERDDIILSTIEADGSLSDWPYGFFNY